MVLFRFEEDLFDQARLLFGIGHQDCTALCRLFGRGVMGFVPVHEIVGTVWVGMALGIPIHVGQHRGGNAMALVRHQLAEGLQGVVRPPLGELRAVDLRQQLADGFTEGQR